INDIVRDESDQKLVAATIAMAHGLGMTVVAERIETEAQYQWLADANCDYLQGWLFSKADSAPAITELLDQHFSQAIESEIPETADIS
ncbi:MAG: EAL domain-containing protein, partial [Pseudomonadota bacterium]|nr:EAL domain-containing protein [Pseudomonadota bacterium]